MNFHERLKEARKKAGMTQRALANKLGLKHNAVSNWEHGHSKPDLAMLGLVCSTLNVSVNYMLNQPATPEAFSVDFNNHEVNLIEQYRTIDDAGKAAIDAMIAHLFSQNCPPISKAPTLEVICGRISIQSAAAGFGVYLDEDDFDEINVAKNRLTSRASFYVPVSGNSMEPKFYDGDILIVEDCPVGPGEIGLFTLGGNGYVKKLGKNTLISLNSNYDPISIDDSIICNGKIIGILEPDWIVE